MFNSTVLHFKDLVAALKRQGHEISEIFFLLTKQLFLVSTDVPHKDFIFGVFLRSY